MFEVLGFFVSLLITVGHFLSLMCPFTECVDVDIYFLYFHHNVDACTFGLPVITLKVKLPIKFVVIDHRFTIEICHDQVASLNNCMLESC